MSLLIEKIRSRSDKIREQRNAFISKLEELEKILSESLKDIDIWAQSSKKSLEMISVDEWAYGYLSFSGGKLEVIYRTTQDDLHDSIEQTPEDFQYFKSKSIRSCPVEWLEKLSTERNVNILLSDIEKRLDSIERNSVESVGCLDKALESQSEEISNGVVDVLESESSDDLLNVWLKARGSIQLDPADSITRSSSYLESVCRFILKETGEAFPNKMDMSSLIGSAVKALDLSDNSEANNDLKQLFGGVKSVFQAIGSMRTHFGTAHGFTPGDYVVNEHYARLINDASATVSTYLLRRLQQKKQAKYGP